MKKQYGLFLLISLHILSLQGKSSGGENRVNGSGDLPGIAFRLFSMSPVSRDVMDLLDEIYENSICNNEFRRLEKKSDEFLSYNFYG
ncbi:MAG: hypothetical protein LIP77_01215, partial [Planctomycetes bacterium]|nr:hypothetical protein [Planctomycetota bacterium]